uniref:Uncharacterized protein n=1 Tax=Chromera velia CCMP2878 TaxID=1169474 RepID=A0A0G4I2N9_9ALVE|mmetsp:Transcript_36820/g.72406  ORF Transcript_36820/g.72406 Transcript_36820/m.72406 type:complete len:268 (-) Transcript_36820:67-870(-)|eukprot:Cvel_1717.t1-p1 / transcript=Cvel_1717.t1 / gene=Cvel_1717 / organism=Chromera_velia_CCMP2878 / gene_product=hypothetical protein / transcript_product=hypothetical protein / location=Cvel_scaffold62:50045-52549(+) / protein_length=267 / sequence_SO=supercontig / SO=protein_coding / is_pseudo=false
MPPKKKTSTFFGTNLPSVYLTRFVFSFAESLFWYVWMSFIGPSAGVLLYGADAQYKLGIPRNIKFFIVTWVMTVIYFDVFARGNCITPASATINFLQKRIGLTETIVDSVAVYSAAVTVGIVSRHLPLYIRRFSFFAWHHEELFVGQPHWWFFVEFLASFGCAACLVVGTYVGPSIRSWRYIEFTYVTMLLTLSLDYTLGGSQINAAYSLMCGIHKGDVQTGLLFAAANQVGVIAAQLTFAPSPGSVLKLEKEKKASTRNSTKKKEN